MILPNWPAPKNVFAFTYLSTDIPLSPIPRYLQQVHGNKVIELPTHSLAPIIADAAVTRLPETFCSIRTADCLPILVTNSSGNEVAAIHAGWRGLLDGIIENTFEKITSPPQDCIAWIGPAICGQCFEVGPEVRAAFVNKNRDFTANFIKSTTTPDKYFGNLIEIADFILKDLGVSQIFHSNICTVEDLRCNSFRRQHRTDQRMITGVLFRKE